MHPGLPRYQTGQGDSRQSACPTQALTQLRSAGQGAGHRRARCYPGCLIFSLQTGEPGTTRLTTSLENSLTCPARTSLLLVFLHPTPGPCHLPASDGTSVVLWVPTVPDASWVPGDAPVSGHLLLLVTSSRITTALKMCALGPCDILKDGLRKTHSPT